MPDPISAIVKPIKTVLKPDKSNPLFKFTVGGIGSALGIWLFGKIYAMLPAQLKSYRYSQQIAKALVAVILYGIGNKFAKGNALARTFVLGSGIGIFGSMVSDAILLRIGAGNATSNNTPPIERTSGVSSRATSAQLRAIFG